MNSLVKFFEERLSGLPCHDDTKSYIIGIFVNYQTTRNDLSQDNLSLQYLQARSKQDFSDYQKFADWVFFVNSLMPEHLQSSREYYNSLAQLSYYSCYRLINKKWTLFEYLADNLVVLEEQVHDKFKDGYNISKSRIKF